MPRKTHTDKDNKRGGRGKSATREARTPRPKPKIDFTLDALDYKNVTLLRQFVTDQGRILPRKYTGLPAHYQRALTKSVKRARQMLLMK
ncbi:MAG TPA: 30S ribosomal protein S18 [Dongiaceae bacterium]|jgi:small subunit ribosomal protein S18|nr:30S ribosomal protein S18 [Dongiaceae bacterium]